MATIVVLHYKHMKLTKPFAPHAMRVPSERVLNQSICRTKEQETRLQCLASAMPKFAMASGAKMRKVCKEAKRKNLPVLDMLFFRCFCLYLWFLLIVRVNVVSCRVIL